MSKPSVARSGDGKQVPTVTPQVERSIDASRGRGRTLDDATRLQMESVFGTSFGDVRIHTDSRADALSRALDARAFTTGNDVFFRKGEYAPGSIGGRELLAHELTHVVQQTGGRVQAKLTVSRPGDRFEREADHMGRVAARAPMVPTVQRACAECEEELQRAPTQGGHLMQAQRIRPGSAPLQVMRDPPTAVATRDEARFDATTELEWRNFIHATIERRGNAMRVAVLSGIRQQSLPSRYDSDVGIFLEAMQVEVAKYAFGEVMKRVPGGELMNAALTGMRDAAERVEARRIDEAFEIFRRGTEQTMQAGIDVMVDPTSRFNIRLQDRIVREAEQDATLRAGPGDDRQGYATRMQTFVRERVNQALFNNPQGDYERMSEQVRDFIQRSWDYFLLARAEVEMEYRRCRSRLMQEGSACDQGFWSWSRYDQDCLHENCRQWLTYAPMPPDWSGPVRTLHMGGPDGRTWYELSTGVEHPAGRAQIPEQRFDRIRDRYRR